MKIGRNDPCPCGSGRKYKHCCLKGPLAPETAVPSIPLSALPAPVAEYAKEQQRMLDAGIHLQFVKPVIFQGQKVWAIGSSLYAAPNPKQTFHEFLIHHLRDVMGEAWVQQNLELTAPNDHFLMRCFRRYGDWTRANMTPDNKEGSLWASEPNGWAQYLMSLAFDVACLKQNSALKTELVRRLRNRDQFQGARYEIAIAAIFSRLRFEVSFYDDRTEAEKHPEFIARHPDSGLEIAVEAKSRHRAGVIHQEGESRSLLKGDIRQLFNRALKKDPGNMPFMIFIDLNSPLTPETRLFEKDWFNHIRKMFESYPIPTPKTPDPYTMVGVTNYSHHYQGEDIAVSGEHLLIRSPYVRHPVPNNLLHQLDRGISGYGFVPALQDPSRSQDG